MSWAPIRYRDFWDVPRVFTVTLRGMTYLFDCPFDDELDEYPDSYVVYMLSPSHGPENWPLAGNAELERVGSVEVRLVAFDPTRRQAIRAEVLANLAS